MIPVIIFAHCLSRFHYKIWKAVKRWMRTENSFRQFHQQSFSLLKKQQANNKKGNTNKKFTPHYTVNLELILKKLKVSY